MSADGCRSQTCPQGRNEQQKETSLTKIMRPPGLVAASYRATNSSMTLINCTSGEDDSIQCPSSIAGDDIYRVPMGEASVLLPL